MPNRSVSATNPTLLRPGFQLNDLDMGMGMGDQDLMSGFLEAVSEQPNLTATPLVPNVLPSGNIGLEIEEPVSWEMLGLGLQESLPPQDMVDEL